MNIEYGDKYMPPKSKYQKILPADEIENKLKKVLNCEFIKVAENNNDVLRKYDMGYAIAVMRYKKRGRTTENYVVALIRFNVRTLTITSTIPIFPEFFPDVMRCFGLAYRECLKILKEKEKEEKKKKLAKFLEKLSPEERKLFLEVLKEKQVK